MSRRDSRRSYHLSWQIAFRAEKWEAWHCSRHRGVASNVVIGGVKAPNQAYGEAVNNERGRESRQYINIMKSSSCPPSKPERQTARGERTAA